MVFFPENSFFTEFGCFLGIHTVGATNYRAEGALTFSAKNTIVSLRAVRMCLCVCVCVRIDFRDSVPQSQRDRKPFNTAQDRYNLARFTLSNRP